MNAIQRQNKTVAAEFIELHLWVGSVITRIATQCWPTIDFARAWHLDLPESRRPLWQGKIDPKCPSHRGEGEGFWQVLVRTDPLPVCCGEACSNSCRRPVALDYWGCAGCCKARQTARAGVCRCLILPIFGCVWVWVFFLRLPFFRSV